VSAFAKPVFFGHYWLTGTPSLQSQRHACVDYSAGKGGPLVAYRYESEPDLSPERFVGRLKKGVTADPQRPANLGG
jgi:hypothetical protein